MTDIYILKWIRMYDESEVLGCYSTREKAVKAFESNFKLTRDFGPNIQLYLKEFKTKDSTCGIDNYEFFTINKLTLDE